MARIGTFSESRRLPGRDAGADPQGDAVGRRPRSWAAACRRASARVTRCAEVEAGASVVVIGCGGVGLNVVQGARLAGAGMIVACDLLDNKLEYARGVRRHPHDQRRPRRTWSTTVREPDRRPRRRLRLRRDRRRGDDAPDPRRRPSRRHRGHRRAWRRMNAGADHALPDGAPGEDASAARCTARCARTSTSRSWSTSTWTAG